ncbi:uncharacterized protein LOC143880318 [Tasmannia lanceolata]|uniref:uncharacterized protein LOC143880318 n=1 Tax=Tasmannia lanceolata TaxID=3420 RepID=UPI0040648390
MVSTPGKDRFVRCPKCWNVLRELANIPVYQCGGCNAILRAKNYDAGGVRSASETCEKNPVQRNETRYNSENNESITSRKGPIPYSTDGDVSDLDREREPDKLRDYDKNSSDGRTDSKADSCSGELNCHGKQVLSEIEESREEDKLRDCDKNSSEVRTNSNVVSSSGELNCHGKGVLSEIGETREEDNLRDCDKNSSEGRTNSNVVSSSGQLDCHGKGVLSEIGETREEDKLGHCDKNSPDSRADSNAVSSLGELNYHGKEVLSEIGETKEDKLSDCDENSSDRRADSKAVSSSGELDCHGKGVLSKIGETREEDKLRHCDKNSSDGRADSNAVSSLGELNYHRKEVLSEIGETKEDKLSDCDENSLDRRADSKAVSSSGELDCHGKGVLSEIGETSEEDKLRDCDKNSSDGRADSKAVSSLGELNYHGKEVLSEIGETKEDKLSDCDENSSDRRADSKAVSSSGELHCHGKGVLSEIGETREEDRLRDCDKNSSDGRADSNAVSSSGELDCHGKGVLSEIGETRENSDENEGKGSNFGSPGHVRRPFTAQTISDESINFKIDNSSLDELVSQSNYHGQYGSNHVRPRDKMEETTESVGDSAISEEDMADTMLGNKLGILSKSPTTSSSRAYYGSVPSYNYDRADHSPDRHLPLSSKRTLFIPRRVVYSTNTKGSPAKETVFVNNEMGINSEAQSQLRKFPSMSLNEKYDSAITGSVSSNEDELSESTRYGFKEHEQGNLLDSEAFYSVRTWTESDMDAASSFRSRDLQYQSDSPTVNQNGIVSNYGQEELLYSPNSYASSKLEYLQHDRMELLRKVKELSGQLSRGKEKERFLIRSTQQETQRPSCYNRNPGQDPSYVQRGKAKERFPIRSTQIETQQHLCYNHDLRLEVLQCCDTKYPWNSPRAYRPRKTAPQQCGSSQMPFSGHATNCKLHADYPCLHCPAQLPLPICYNQGPCMACPGMCHHSHSSIPASPPRWHMDSNFPPHFHSAHVHEGRLMDHEIEKFHYKEKRQPLKRHCLPIAGGAPFVLCYRCQKLLQLPADFLLSRRTHHKLQCGACSTVLSFSFQDRTHIACYTPTQIPHPPIEVDKGTGNLTSSSHANSYLQGDRISYSDDGLTNVVNYSTEGDTALLSPPFPVHQSGATGKKHAPSSLPDAMEQKREEIPEQSEKKSQNSGRAPESVVITSLDVAKSEKSSLETSESIPMVGSKLHRLMGYSSPSEMINGSGDRGEGSESGDLQILENSHSLSEEKYR